MREVIKHLREDWYKYLLEVFVLIIGIYGAFAVEEWGESRKEAIQEQQILKQLLSDYESNLQQLDQKIEDRKNIIKEGLSILNYIDNPTNANIDSLVFKLGSITIDPTFDPIENNLINSGNIHLISNPTLSKLLTNWTSDLVALQELEEIWTNIAFNEYAPSLYEMGIARSVIHSFWYERKQNWVLDQKLETVLNIGESSSLPPMKEILENKELEGLVTYAVSMNHGANIQSLALRKKIEEILSLLKQEIK